MFFDQDLHLHTNLSFCASRNVTLADYIEEAKKLGQTTIGISNHFWDEKIPCTVAKEFYEGQNYPHICELKKELSLAESSGIRVLFGAEGEYDPVRRDIAVTEEIAEKLDFLIIPNSHTHMTMPREYYEDRRKFADFMLTAYRDILHSSVSKYVTAMAHPFSAVCCPFDNEELYPLISEADYREIFEETAGKGIAIEINSAGLMKKSAFEVLRKSPVLSMFRIAKECGCKFVYGSDAHSKDAPAKQIGLAHTIAALLDLKDDDIKRI